MKKFYLFIVILFAFFAICYALDPGFQQVDDVNRYTTEVMTWNPPEVIVSTGPCSLSMITNGGYDYVGSPTFSSLPAGTTVYFPIQGKSVTSSDGVSSLTIGGNGGSYVHAQWFVKYKVSYSSAVGQ